MVREIRGAGRRGKGGSAVKSDGKRGRGGVGHGRKRGAAVHRSNLGG